VNGKTVSTTGQWERALKSSQGKPVDVTVMREHKTQTLKMVAGPVHTTSELELVGVPLRY
jgi:S1-C subfamily serine protease